MKLIDIFSQLTYGELSQISIGGGAAGEINPSNYDQVLAHVNLGLTALYTRFPLKEKQLSIPLLADTTTYSLDIVDLLKIVSVKTDANYELKLNAADDPYSCRTPSLNTIRVPQVIVEKNNNLPDVYKTGSLLVIYRANHPVITQAGSFLPETYEVELPYSHLEALLLFVASRVNNPIGMVNEFNAGNNYAAKYEQACQALENKGAYVEEEQSNYRAVRNGWV